MEKRILIFLSLCLVLSLNVFAVSIVIPGNSDFGMYMNFKYLGEVGSVFQESGIPEVLGAYGKLSLGGLGQIFGFARFIDSEDFSMKGLIGLPIGIVFPGNIGDKTFSFLLGTLLDSSIQLPSTKQNEIYSIVVDNAELYVIRSKDSIYLCFTEDIAMFTKDALTGKLNTVTFATNDKVVLYFKTYKQSLFGDILYSFGDYLGIPNSDELIVTTTGENKYHFEVTVNKTYIDYEKKLALAKSGLLKGLSYIDNANLTLIMNASNLWDLISFPLLSEFGVDSDLNEIATPLQSFIDTLDSVALSMTMLGDFVLSLKYKPEGEQDAAFIVSFLKQQLNEEGFEVFKDKQFILVYPESIDKTKLKTVTDNSLFIFRLNYDDGENIAQFGIQSKIMQNGNVLISGDFENIEWFLEMIFEGEEEDYEEEYYEYYEEDEEYTTEETMETTSEDEYYEEEIYEYSDIEYEIADEIERIFNAVFDFLGNEGIQEVTLEKLYDHDYIEYIPDYFDVKNVIMTDGVIYVIIHFDISQYDVMPENVVEILNYHKGIYSDVINGKLSLILYYTPSE